MVKGQVKPSNSTLMSLMKSALSSICTNNILPGQNFGALLRFGGDFDAVVILFQCRDLVPPWTLDVRIFLEVFQNDGFESVLIECHRIQWITRIELPLSSSNNLSIGFAPADVSILKAQLPHVLEDTRSLEFKHRWTCVDGGTRST
jgi:hypothetical protein